jgi:hypothetical protein
MATAAILAHLDSTIHSLDQGLTHAKTGAVRSINSWVETLSGAGVPALGTLADELKHLEELLASDKATGPQLKKALTSLGKHTTAAAASAEGASADKIKQIGKLLADAAGSIS